MRIEKRVTESGEIEILIDGDKITSKMSRQLTGTTCEAGEGADLGIFSTTATEGSFNFGAFHQVIAFGNLLYVTDPAASIAEKIVGRIEKVRAWVARCRNTSGVIEVENVGAVIDNLYAEGNLYYRNRKGQIRALD